MNKVETLVNPEWLSDIKTKSIRFGQLGLSENQKYSELSEEEKQLLNMTYSDRSFVSDSYNAFCDNHDVPVKNRDSFRRTYVDKFMKIYNGFSGAFIAPDGKSSEQLAMALTDSLLSLDVSFEKIQKINHLMLQPDTPNFAKQMATFKVLYPDLKAFFRRELGERRIRSAYNRGDNYISSPILNNIDEFGAVKDEDGYLYKAEDVIYRDLLKCAFGSGGNNVRKFLNKLSIGSSMMYAIMCWPDSEEQIEKYYSKEDLKDLQTLISQLHSIHYQTKVGSTEEYDEFIVGTNDLYDDFGKKSIFRVKDDIKKIFDEYQPTKRYDLADRVVRSFCYPLGIKDLSGAYEYLNNMRDYSFFRHQNLIANGEVGYINNGCFVKAVGNSDHLPYLFESGVLAKEYLGVGASSDCTPLDTDVAMITDGTHGLKHAIRQSCASAFSGFGNDDTSIYYAGSKAENIFLFFRNDSRFFVNSSTGDRSNDDDSYLRGDDGFYYSMYNYYSYCLDEDGHEYDDDKHRIPYRYYGKSIYKKNNYEVFPPLEHFVIKREGDYSRNIQTEFYEDDYGIRTGIPSSEIDYIATDERSANNVIKAVKESGLYIPVTDLDGNLIYNPFES